MQLLIRRLFFGRPFADFCLVLCEDKIKGKLSWQRYEHCRIECKYIIFYNTIFKKLSDKDVVSMMVNVPGTMYILHQFGHLHLYPYPHPRKSMKILCGYGCTLCCMVCIVGKCPQIFMTRYFKNGEYWGRGHGLNENESIFLGKIRNSLANISNSFFLF